MARAIATRVFDAADRTADALGSDDDEAARPHHSAVSADFIDALQESQLEEGPLGPIVPEPPTPWPLRSANGGVRYH